MTVILGGELFVSAPVKAFRYHVSGYRVADVTHPELL